MRWQEPCGDGSPTRPGRAQARQLLLGAQTFYERSGRGCDPYDLLFGDSSLPSFARHGRVEGPSPHGWGCCNAYAACPALAGNASAPSVRV